MSDNPQTRRNRLWQISLVTLFGVLTLSAILLAIFQPERPPPPLTPTTETERQILKLAQEFVRTRAPDYKVPIKITRVQDSSFAVEYWTPRNELALLGKRVVIVDSKSKTVELEMRD
jgi:hypothetical protein